MSLNIETTYLLNGSQTPIDACDQPVNALTKTIQWKYPRDFGMGNYFTLLGGLHIEQQNLLVHGELLNGSGFKEILETRNFQLLVHLL